MLALVEDFSAYVEKRATEEPTTDERPTVSAAEPRESYAEIRWRGLAELEAGHLEEAQNAENGVELLESYEEARRQAVEELKAGRLDEALGFYQQSRVLAERMGDRELIDLAFCNQVAILLTLGRCQGNTLQRLREILVRARTQELSLLGAYNLSHAYELEKAYKKALFYAQIARDRALAIASKAPDETLALSYSRLAQCHNQIGKCLVAESRFEPAIAEFEQALEYLGEEPSIERIGVLTNLAYPLALVGHRKEAFSILFNCVRWYRRQGNKLHEAWPHLCLCYLYSDIGRLRRAWLHGHKGLELAESTGDSEAIRISLFLLGDIEKMAGEYADAYGYYSRLRDEFYPNDEELPETLLFVDTRQLVNLRA